MKTWLITGCSSGIGAGIARAALEHGGRAVVTARKPETLQELVKEFPDRALALKLDITDKADICAAVTEAVRQF